MMGDDVEDEALDQALEALSGDAKKARVARILPEDKRPTKLMIELGLMPAGEEHATRVPAVQSEDEEGIVGPSDFDDEDDEDIEV